MKSPRACLLLFGIMLVTSTKGTEGNKRGHIIESLFADMRSDPTGERPSNSEHNTLPSGSGIIHIPIPHGNDLKRLRSLLLNENNPGISLDRSKHDLTQNLQNNRYMHDIDRMEMSNRMWNGLDRYIIKKVKREPENFPIEMYPVQGGKQQLEVDLDHELNGKEDEIVGKENDMVGEIQRELIGQERQLKQDEYNSGDNENELSENDTSKDNQTADTLSREQVSMFPADIIFGGADLSQIETRTRLNNPLKENNPDPDSRRKRSFGKRFWAAKQLYRLRTPKSHWGRTHGMRTALPRFDPILYFIGLGK